MTPHQPQPRAHSDNRECKASSECISVDHVMRAIDDILATCTEMTREPLQQAVHAKLFCRSPIPESTWSAAIRRLTAAGKIIKQRSRDKDKAVLRRVWQAPVEASHTNFTAYGECTASSIPQQREWQSPVIPSHPTPASPMGAVLMAPVTIPPRPRRVADHGLSLRRC